ncbi:uncharacterized protein LOC6585780 [Drosophila mojavensis]|uniref:Uncharacterized protein, isoform A n=1 Tax=Drosophila mojavensis TaxID=7230 RepID=B4L7A2_DROMO|nr:uncharacterized protein LOC6585780 [Drosophila mojavensis]XP_032588827.1 uncharacterized protein LOC6585780 [Drosophila mojavensis]EDW10896.1 uncharacterized protein Dmoj_GI14084, isoform A [Drosophila mojavensis]KRG07245.1 uncharacterized protein Dmoj_GI14084, isoform B [Drosophila mojavensis]
MSNEELAHSRSSSPCAVPQDSSLKSHFVAPTRQTAPQATSMALEQYRLQLYNYALNIERLRCPPYGTAGSTAGLSSWLHPYSSHGVAGSAGNRLATLSTISLFPQSQRIFHPEEPKPQHSYIGLIAMAILSSAEMKLVLSDIYQYILDNYPYFRTRGPGWRNSIRHNLSLNDCFIKSGRSANGKGHYWAIHPANMDDFRKGDFRRRKAQRKVRRHMGLSIDDASTDSPSPPPLDLTTPPPAAQASMQLAALNYPYHQQYIGQFFGRSPYSSQAASEQRLEPGYQLAHHQHHQHPNQNPNPHTHSLPHHHPHLNQHQHIAYINSTTTTTIANLYSQTRKRQFDVASLLAPDVHIVDIVEGEDSSTQHTVITKVQVKKQQLFHRELVAEQPNPNSSPSSNLNLSLNTNPALGTCAGAVDADVDADIDVDGDGDGDVEGDGDGRQSEGGQRLLSTDDNNSYLSDTKQSLLDADIAEQGQEPEPEQQDPLHFSASVSPPLGSSRASSSQHDSNSLEECPPGTTASPELSTMSTMSMSLNSVDPQILRRYYGSYMAAAARQATLEASSRAQLKNMAAPTPQHPPIELLPNKS